METPHGIYLETGSYGRSRPFGLHPGVYPDPKRYIDGIVRPLIDKQGVTNILWHRPLGEPVQGDPGMDLDAFYYHMTEPAGDRAFALRQVGLMGELAQEINLTVYIGAIWQKRMRDLLEAKKYGEWAARIDLQTRAFPGASFAFDGSANPNKMNQMERLAIRMLEASLPSMMIEALPDDNIPELHGMDACVWEHHWPSEMGQEKNCRSVTRIMGTHSVNEDPTAFAKDCAERGHRWFVHPNVLRKAEITFADMVEAGEAA